MDCPSCNTQLIRETYESVPVLQCQQCAGYFVSRERLLLIKSKRDVTESALHQEASSEKQFDTEARVPCPKCKAKMEKEPVKRDDGFEFSIDLCRDCDRIWLDGGELAQLQLEHEKSAAAMSQFAHQERFVSQTDEQRQQHSENLRKAAPTFMTSAMQEVWYFMVVLGLYIAVAVLFAIDRSNIALVTSFAATGTMTFRGLQQVDSVVAQNAWLAVATVLQITFLSVWWFF